MAHKETEVWAACEQLTMLNKPLTYFAIGEQLLALGFKRCHQSDIRRYLKTWRKHHDINHVPQHIPLTQTTHSGEAVFMTNTPNPDDMMASQLMRFYQHHLEQFDRLINIIEVLKKENNMLRNIIKKKDTSGDHELPATKYRKPRVTCKTFE